MNGERLEVAEPIRKRSELICLRVTEGKDDRILLQKLFLSSCFFLCEFWKTRLWASV